MLPPPEDLSSLKIEPEDENLKHILSKARRLKQKENIIQNSKSDEETGIELNLNNFHRWQTLKVSVGAKGGVCKKDTCLG
jgi:hypothetical protein